MTTETMPARTTAGSPLPATPRRFRGLLVIASVIAGSWAVFTLFERPPTVIQRLELSAQDGSLSVFLPAPGSGGHVRVVLAKTPVGFDPTASLLDILDQDSTRVVPGNARIVLVEANGPFVALKTPPPSALLLQVTRASAAPELPSLAAWFKSEPVAKALATAAPQLRSFFE